MDTTLEDRRINWLHIFLYGVIAALPGIIGNLVYVYIIGTPMSDTYVLSFNEEYMDKIGIHILYVLNWLSIYGIAFWIAKPNRTRTLYNGMRLLVVVIVVELLFFWIIGVEFKLRYSFSWLFYLVAIALAGVTPFILKGKRKHLKDWDAKKDEDYDKKTRK